MLKNIFQYRPVPRSKPAQAVPSRHYRHSEWADAVNTNITGAFRGKRKASLVLPAYKNKLFSPSGISK